MIRLQISLESDTYRRAKEQARSEGISIAEFVRRAITKALPHQPYPGARPWMRYSGCLDSGDPKSSQTVNKVVYDALGLEEK